MDLQVKLVADGHAATYASPEIPGLPKWAVWKNQAYGTTYEPITFVYNKRLVPEADVPKDHTALLKLLKAKPDSYKGKVTAYDPEKLRRRLSVRQSGRQIFSAGLGSVQGHSARSSQALHLGRRHDGARDVRRAPDRLRDLRLLCARPFEEGPEPRHRHAEGLHAGHLARRLYLREGEEPECRRSFSSITCCRSAGRTIIANQAELYSLRDDVDGEATVKRVAELIGDKARPVPIDRRLLANLDQTKRLAFLQEWQAAMKGQ